MSNSTDFQGFTWRPCVEVLIYTDLRTMPLITFSFPLEEKWKNPYIEDPSPDGGGRYSQTKSGKKVYLMLNPKFIAEMRALARKTFLASGMTCAIRDIYVFDINDGGMDIPFDEDGLAYSSSVKMRSAYFDYCYKLYSSTKH